MGDNNYHYPVDVDRTMTEIDQRFTDPNSSGLYVSPSEICDIFLIPKRDTKNPLATASLSRSNILANFWNANRITADNLRERPYGLIYPRLTTKSNVYTVHYTVQTLKKVPGTAPEVWCEGKDQVQGEQRGATTVERYIDPRDPEFNLPGSNFAAEINGAQPTLERFYKFRTIATRQFRP